MESRSEISSRTYNDKSSQRNEIPSIHIEQYLDGRDEHFTRAQGQSKLRSYPKIFTVAQTLKDPLILKNIKPDYGSLGEFIGDLNIGRDLLNQKKKKNDGSEQQIEQKKAKQIFKEKTKQQLNSIFLDPSRSNIQKRVASRLMVENIFKQSFGVTINNFESQNVKIQQAKNSKINIGNIDEIFSGKKHSVKDENRNQKKVTKVTDEIKETGVLDERKLNKSRPWTYKQRIQMLQEIKYKYIGLRKQQIKTQSQQYKKLFPPKTQQEFIDMSKHSSQPDQPQKAIHKLQINESQFLVERLTIKGQLILYLFSSNKIELLQKVVLNQVRISDQLLCFILEVIKVFCYRLKKLELKCISLQRTQNVCMKIKQLLENSDIKEINLQYLDLQTKQFCMVCLGIGGNVSLQSISFDNNGIDQRACKSLQLITKHCQTLKKICLRKNFVKPHHISYFSVEAKSKIML